MRDEAWLPGVAIDGVAAAGTMSADELPGGGGWRVRYDATASGLQIKLSYYVVRDRGQLAILAMAPNLAAVGAEALATLAKGDRKGARQWLTWAWEDAAEKPSLDDANLEIAAALLMTEGSEVAAKAAVPILRPCAKNDQGAGGKCSVGLVLAYRTLGQHREALELADRLVAAAPDDESLEHVKLALLVQAKASADVEAASRAWLARHPDDVIAKRTLAEALAAQGKLVEAAQTYGDVLGGSSGEARDVNEAAWYLLVAGQLDDAAAVLERGVGSGGSTNSFAFLNTKATILAERGDLVKAYEALGDDLVFAGVTTPRYQDWLVWGRIAEACELPELARAAYQKAIAGDPDPKRTTSVANLARRWLKRLDRR